MMREVYTIVFIVCCGVLGTNGHMQQNECNDAQGSSFETLLSHLKAFEANVQQQIGTLSKEISDVKGEIACSITEMQNAIRMISGGSETNIDVRFNDDDTESGPNKTPCTMRKTCAGVGENSCNTESAVKSTANETHAIVREMYRVIEKKIDNTEIAINRTTADTQQSLREMYGEFEKKINNIESAMQRCTTGTEQSLRDMYGEIEKKIANTEDAINRTAIDTKDSLRDMYGEIEKKIDNTESAIKRTTTDTQTSLQAMIEEIEKKIDATDTSIRKLAEDQAASATAVQNSLLALNTDRGQCVSQDVFSKLLEDQSNQLIRRMERTTVASGKQQLNLGGNTHDVYVDSSNKHGFGGNWIVFVTALNGAVNFNRSWAEFKEGFGDLEGEHWLGLEKLYLLLQRGRHEMLVLLDDCNGVMTYEHYDDFQIGHEYTGYTISSLGTLVTNTEAAYTGIVGYPFQTYDNDYRNCAKQNGVGFWFDKCDASTKVHKDPPRSRRMMVRPHKH